LLAPTHENSPIAKFLEKRGEGIHHIAFEVENIEQAISEKNAAGFELIHFKAKSGADNKLIAFLHPKSTGGVLTELCQDKIN
jgi:methylmalonyl-CoA/ethylmalonyl-CoA epimerase